MMGPFVKFQDRSRLKVQPLADGKWNGDLPLGGDGRFHVPKVRVISKEIQ